MAKISAPIQVIIYYPKTEEDRRKLAEQAANVHADMVNQYIRKLNCPSEQKILLLNAVINAASNKKQLL